MLSQPFLIWFRDDTKGLPADDYSKAIFNSTCTMGNDCSHCVTYDGLPNLNGSVVLPPTLRQKSFADITYNPVLTMWLGPRDVFIAGLRKVDPSKNFG